jgi:hypothetical protein
LNLVPPGLPNDRLFVWTDMVAVKSSGPGHGTTALDSVGHSPSALISWLSTNHDFVVVSPPTSTTIAKRIPATTMTVGVSTSANYGDPACPSNPRCADLFTNLRWWGDNSFGIGGDEEVQLSIASIRASGSSHTLFVTLDAPDQAQLATLIQTAAPIVGSFWLPSRIRPG